MLLELTRHSDHHYRASRKYQILRHFDDSPQMPTGYPGMMLLALVPPLWFRVMHKQIDKYRATITCAPNFAYAQVVKRLRDQDLETLDLSCLRVAGCGAEPIHAPLRGVWLML